MDTTRLARCRLAPLAFALVLAVGSIVAPPAMADDGTLTHENLKSLLEGLGYEPEEGHFTDTGNAYYTISKETPGLTVFVDFNLTDPEFLWLSVDYWGLTGEQEFPRQVLLDLLAENQGLIYVHFLYLANERRMRLAGSLPNRDIKPADVRRMLDEAVAVSAATQHLWNPNNWQSAQ